MRATIATVVVALLLGACGEVIYTGLDESGRPIEQSTTSAASVAPGGQPAQTPVDVSLLDAATIATLGELADAIGNLAAAGRNVDGPLGFIACDQANDRVAELEESGLLGDAGVPPVVVEAVAVAEECGTSNSVRTYLDLADRAGAAAGDLRSLVRSASDG
jgi:hypothetical protein